MEHTNAARLARLSMATLLGASLVVPSTVALAQNAAAVQQTAASTSSATVGSSSASSTASKSSYKKSQVVYVKEDADGKKTGVYVVNGVTAPEGTTVNDAGSYTNVTNLTSTDELSDENGHVAVTGAGEQESVYQGDLSVDTQLPWNVDVSYKLDGVAVDANDLAGKSGRLTMELSITPNAAYKGKGDYTDNYLVQAVGQLNSDHVRSIEADGATTAANGSNTQLTYMVLPGSSAHYTITAQVEDFEFDGWQVVGVPMAMALDIDENSVDTSQLVELSDGIATLNDGAQTLNDGTNTLANGVSALRAKLGDFTAGTSALKDGAATLQGGLDQSVAGAGQLQAGATSLSQALSMMQAQVEQSRGEVKQQAEALGGQLTSTLTNAGAKSVEAAQTAGGVAQGLASTNLEHVEHVQVNTDGLTPDQAQAVQAAVDQANAQIDARNAQIDATNAKLQGYAANASAASASAAEAAQGLASIDATSLTSLSAALDAKLGALSTALGQAAGTNGAGALAAGSGSLVDGLGLLSQGAGTLAAGTSQVDDGAQLLAGGVATLDSGASALADGTSTLAAGTQELTDRTSDLDGQVIATIKDKIESMLNPQFELTDFVNGEQGEHIQRVQFVYMTGAISK